MLTVTPFLTLIDYDSRSPKTVFLMACLSVLCIWSLYLGNKLERISNKWLAVFFCLLPLNIWLAPKLLMEGTNLIASFSYLFHTSMQMLLCLFGYLSIRNYWKETKDENIFKIMVWSGFVMSLYVILQIFGYDQFQYVKDGLYLGNKSILDMWMVFDSPRSIGGTLGNPTIVSPFIGMVIPLALRDKKYIKAVLMLLAVLSSMSMVAIGGLVIASCVWVACRYKQHLRYIIIAGLAVCCLGVFGAKKVGVFNDNGRLEQWKEIYSFHKSEFIDGTNKSYQLTGIGVGAFRHTYPIMKKNDFHQAHNEYLEILVTMGLFGLIAFMMFLFTWFRSNRDKCPYLLSSLVYICACAFGTFVWQIAPIALYTITITAIMEEEDEEII
jgi:hypothetical protein